MLSDSPQSMWLSKIDTPRTAPIVDAHKLITLFGQLFNFSFRNLIPNYLFVGEHNSKQNITYCSSQIFKIFNFF